MRLGSQATHNQSGLTSRHTAVHLQLPPSSATHTQLASFVENSCMQHQSSVAAAWTSKNCGQIASEHTPAAQRACVSLNHLRIHTDSSSAGAACAAAPPSSPTCTCEATTACKANSMWQQGAHSLHTGRSSHTTTQWVVPQSCPHSLWYTMVGRGSCSSLPPSYQLL